MEPIKVAVIDEHEIFRRGVAACLREQADVVVVDDGDRGAADADVVIASEGHAARKRFPCPVLVCAVSPPSRPLPPGRNRVAGILPRASLTPEQLLGATRAAAAGLEVQVAEDDEPRRVDGRTLEILRLLADGADTQQISQHLHRSARAVKGDISQIQRELAARNRAEAVAKAIRQGLI